MDNPSPAPGQQPYLPLPGHAGVPPHPLPILGELPVDLPPWKEPRDHRPPLARQRLLLPLALFVATCASTVWAWAGNHLHLNVTPDGVRVVKEWSEGFEYMAAVMGILLAHEMGHFIQALRYGVPASLPFFIPMPFTPIGTMGAVIGMQGSEADRKELFDIGLSGPLAGLVVALPLIWFGVTTADPFPLQVRGDLHFQDPLLFKVLMWLLRPDLLPGQELALNPLLMAGWVGLLITGLNMLPVSQLDGGHVAYALFGRGSFWLARGVILAAIAFMVMANVYGWVVMLFLVMMIGIEHPPTANDRAPLGWGRKILGLASLAIPILCLAPDPITVPR
ncbi:MAG: site-2 protease family protein [Planctomycetia bacterium]|nr:site-2 protease family protein [Planctomycetia bacterium]